MLFGYYDTRERHPTATINMRPHGVVKGIMLRVVGEAVRPRPGSAPAASAGNCRPRPGGIKQAGVTQLVCHAPATKHIEII